MVATIFFASKSAPHQLPTLAHSRSFATQKLDSPYHLPCCSWRNVPWRRRFSFCLSDDMNCLTPSVMFSSLPPPKLLTTIQDVLPFITCVINVECIIQIVAFYIWCCASKESHLSAHRVYHLQHEQLDWMYLSVVLSIRVVYMHPREYLAYVMASAPIWLCFDSKKCSVFVCVSRCLHTIGFSTIPTRVHRILYSIPR